MTTIEEILTGAGITLVDPIELGNTKLVEETELVEKIELAVMTDIERRNSVYFGKLIKPEEGAGFEVSSRFEVNQTPKLLLSNYGSTSNGNTFNARNFVLLESETWVLSRNLKSELLINPICSNLDLRKPRVGTKYKQILETHHGIVLVEIDASLDDENVLTAINDYAGLLQSVTTTNGVPLYVGVKSEKLSNKYGDFLIKHSGLFPNQGSNSNGFTDVHDTLTSLVFIQHYFEHCGVNYDSIRVTYFSYDHGLIPTMDGLTSMKVVALQEKYGFPLPKHIILDINKVSNVKDNFPQTFEQGLEACFGELRNVTATSKTIFSKEGALSLSGKPRPAYVRETTYYCQNVK